jgi:hypothetical protein
MRGILLAAAAVAWSGLAAAQEHPPLVPAKDVTVEYHYKSVPTGAPAQEGQSRISTAADGKRMRVEGFVPSGYMIMDRANSRTIMVMNTQHMYIEMPFDPARAGPLMLRDNMKFARKGSDTVAGVRCTVWDIQGDQGSGTGCITDDGVLLRAESNGRNGQVQMTATAVKYGALTDDLFQPPAGYQKLQTPTMPPGAGRPAMPPQQKP